MSRHQESLYRFGGGVDLVSGSFGAASLGAISATSYLSAGAGNPFGVPGAIFAGGLAAGSYLHAESGGQKLLRKFESDAGSRVLASFERPVGESYLGRKAKVIALDLATSAASAKVAGMAVKAVDGLPKLSFAKRLGKVDDARVTKAELVNKQEVVLNFSEEGSGYFMRIDPITNSGPLHFDTSKFTNPKSYTKFGANRDGGQFWKGFNEKYPGMISETNMLRIKKNRSPFVDDLWLEHFPEHHRYFGQKIEHHHINHGDLAYPLPKELHRSKESNKFWHDIIKGNKK